MGGSPEQPKDKRGFRRLAKDVLRRAKDGFLDGESMELTGDTETDAAGLLRMIAGAVGNDPKALDDTLAEGRRITDVLGAATDFPNIAQYDATLLAKLEFVATHFYSVNNDAVNSGPLTLSSDELASPKGDRFRTFVAGPEICPDNLVDAISTLRQIGQDVVGVYDSGGDNAARIHYNPAGRAT